MKQAFYLLAICLAAASAHSQDFATQKELDEHLAKNAADISFLAFEAESTWGVVTRCQLQYRVVASDARGTSAPQVIQGTVASDYYDGRVVNYVLNVQPLRIDVDPRTHNTSSRTINPVAVGLVVNGLALAPYEVGKPDCDGGVCVAYAPATAEGILTFAKAAYARPVFDAEVSYTLAPNAPPKTFKLAAIPMKIGSAAEARKDFTQCLQAIVKRTVGDIKGIVGVQQQPLR